jgi:hypothetical protein
LGRLVWIVAFWTLYLTVFPLESVGVAEAAERLISGLSNPSAARPLLHMVSLGVFGALFGLRSGSISRRRAVGVILGFVLALELLQGFAPSRHPRGGDLLLNTVSAGAAYALARAIDRRRCVSARIEARAAPIARALTLAAALFLCVSLLLHERDLSFATWDPSHGFALGNELTWNRPWAGAIEGLAIYDDALGDTEVGRLSRAAFDASGVALRRERGAVALYDFTADGDEISDRSAFAPPLALLRAGSERVAERGLAIDARSRVHTGSAAKLFGALRDGSELSVELRCRSNDSTQVGPARIVSFSADPYVRNFTVGQQGDALVFRLRTPPNGDNGLETPVAWPGAFSDGATHHFVLTYARGRARAFRDGVALAPDTWRLDWPSPRLARIPTARPHWAAALLFFPLASLVSLGWRRVSLRVRLPAQACVAGSLAAASTLLGVVLYRTSWDPTLPVLAALSAPFLDLCGSLLARASRSDS